MNPLFKGISKIASWFKAKTVVVGLNQLSRIFSDTWGNSKYLGAYEKSLYVYACVSKIAEKVASTRFQAYQIINSKGDIKELMVHPVLDLINKPNPFQTKTQFLETTIINLKLSGNAFWFKVRNGSGKVIELWNLRPDLITIINDPELYIKAYKLQKQDGKTELFKPEDIIHFKYSSPLDEYFGMSPLRPAAVRVDIEEFANKYQRDFFVNNARPDAVLEFEGELMDEQKDDIRDGWNSRHRGVGKNSKIGILEGGVKYHQVSLSQREMDYIESMKFTRDDILVAFKVPKPIVAITDDVNRANAETAMFIFLSETIKPELERITESLNEMLVYPDFGDRFFVDFPDPTPENREAKLMEYEKGLAGNYLLINEVRARENLPPIKGGWSFYQPLGMAPVGGIPQAQADEAEKTVKADHRRKVFQGKPLLREKLELMDSVMVVVKSKLFKKKKKKTEDVSNEATPKKERKLISLITGEEMRTQYYNVINKKIDKRAAKFQEAVNHETRQQMKRVEAKLENVAKSFEGSRIKIKASEIFDKAKENKLMAQIALPFLTEYLLEGGKDAISIVAPADEFVVTEALRKLLDKRAKEFAEEVNNTTLEKLTGTISEGIADGEGIRELSDRVEEVYDEFPSYRSERIARTETTAVNNEGALQAYRQSNVANAKEWINSGDSRVRDEHQDGSGVGGEIVALDSNFSNGLKFPSEPNCRCVLAPAFIEE